MTAEGRDLEALLATHQSELTRVVRQQARGILRYETLDDLIQGVNCHALSVAGRFEYQGQPQFLSWLAQVAKQHVASRLQYWSRLKRGSARLLRLTQGDVSRLGDSRVAVPAESGPGVTTFAWRREQLTLVARAMNVLSDRDRQFVRWAADDLPLAEQATQLGLTYAATQRAAARAVERFRKTFRLVSRGRGSAPA